MGYIGVMGLCPANVLTRDEGTKGRREIGEDGTGTDRSFFRLPCRLSVRRSLRPSLIPLRPFVPSSLRPFLLLPLLCGCETQRLLKVNSDPPDALVYLNGEEVGRTPLVTNFKWYGTYDVAVRKDGFEAVHRQEKVWAPWWQVPPIDLLVAVTPGPHVDEHDLSYQLREPSAAAIDPSRLLARGEQLQGQLESTQRTHPTTQPFRPATTRPVN